ncbi:hypothetical protein GO730_09615 [Spirosoma sp. HMF3257]|uniref:Uncharacterized protein n=1 Tax=Spirosoma telluris TaxID=2183553 RepID=A0A327NGF5_9BACT|nr:hypothetical protein [Spirosoma telluris]RAI74451.1 hypothetical protein HMF3257_09520 [Spirosoma telluris]
MLNECLLIRDFSSGGSNLLAWMGVGIQFLLFTVFYWQFGRQQWSAEKMPASNLLMWPFVLTAVVYVLVLFSLRTVSPFSDPNLRLMAPFTYCFLTAGLLWVSEWPACWQKNLRPYWLLLLLCSWLQLLPQHDLLQRISLLLE